LFYHRKEEFMEIIDPEKKIREVVDACSDCDICRYLMETNCLFFPELYRLYDEEKQTGRPISSMALRRLVDLCNYCALCACPNIRQDIMLAKTGFIAREGLSHTVKILEDVEKVGTLCGTFPRLSNFLFQHRLTAGPVKQAAGIHPDRVIPRFPETDFPTWARRQGLSEKPLISGARRKVAYFVGCTGRFLFPEVAQAAVQVLQKAGVELFFPEQKCCGMPTMLEGDREKTLEFTRATVAGLIETVEDGFSIVCSCPTCGYMIKHVLREGAYYATEYQRLVGGDDKHFKIPADMRAPEASRGPFVLLIKSIYGKILRDNGYFSGIDPLKRIKVAESTYDLGEYLQHLDRSGEMTLDFKPVPTRSVYFAPCHQREQGIGSPYPELLNHVPGLSIVPIEGKFLCCGMSGIMGFKKDFHEASIHMGRELAETIDKINPDTIITDCLSCRLQFKQMTRIQVRHPVEMLRESLCKSR
jgi:glycerol-3-phosphate dehydrogenase subunit C